MTERHDSQGLGAEAEAMLRALRDDEDMPPATQARVWRRLAAQTEGAGPQGHVRRSMSPGAWAVVALAAAAVVLLASRVGVIGPLVAERGGEAANYSKAEEAPAPVVSRAAAPVRAAADSAGAVPEDRAEATPASEPARARTERPREAKVKEERAAAAPGEQEERAAPGEQEERAEAAPAGREQSSLAEEAAVLARAQAEIQGGRAEAAVEELAGYARRFPNGALREEYEALRAIALCEAGRTREGRGEAQAFLRERAGSALGDRVRGACLSGQ
jgi:hypothetical protein